MRPAGFAFTVLTFCLVLSFVPRRKAPRRPPDRSCLFDRWQRKSFVRRRPFGRGLSWLLLTLFVERSGRGWVRRRAAHGGPLGSHAEACPRRPAPGLWLSFRAAPSLRQSAQAGEHALCALTRWLGLADPASFPWNRPSTRQSRRRSIARNQTQTLIQERFTKPRQGRPGTVRLRDSDQVRSLHAPLGDSADIPAEATVSDSTQIAFWLQAIYQATRKISDW